MMNNQSLWQRDFFRPGVPVGIWSCQAIRRQRAGNSGRFLNVLSFRIFSGLTRTFRKGTVH